MFWPLPPFAYSGRASRPVASAFVGPIRTTNGRSDSITGTEELSWAM